jgi:2-amino-4-hydroxy-6-hydroxymethyldihydropteridine diphosphokinase
MTVSEPHATRPRRWIIALGSNVADPSAALDLAWQACVAALDLDAPQLSALHHTAPAEQASGPLFVNAVGVGYSPRDPQQGLADLHAIESAFGRDRPREGFAAPLQLPHPRWHLRPFVVLPLAEVAPDLLDPHGRTAADLARAMSTAQGLVPLP